MHCLFLTPTKQWVARNVWCPRSSDDDKERRMARSWRTHRPTGACAAQKLVLGGGARGRWLGLAGCGRAAATSWWWWGRPWTTSEQGGAGGGKKNRAGGGRNRPLRDEEEWLILNITSYHYFLL